MDYKNGKIYTIRSPHTDKFYIGSTTTTLSKRFSDHRSKYKSHLEGKKTKNITSFEILKLGDAYIELFEECPTENKNQLHKREGELIREYKERCVNVLISGRDNIEYYVENKDEINKKHRQYYDENKDEINRKRRDIHTKKKEQKLMEKCDTYEQKK